MTTSDSPEQAAVIHAPADADLLVVAGAGSGKTRTMTRRIIALIRDGVPPESILGLTFTRKAAGELLSRVSAAVAEDSGSTGDRLFLKPEVHTYDAFFQSIVRQYGLLVGFDASTQPLSEAGALQLASDVIDRRRGDLPDIDLGGFDTLAGRVLALSDAIGSAMIGEGCDGIAEAVTRIRDWDRAFLDRVRDALGDTPVPAARPRPLRRPAPPRRAKSDSDGRWQDKQEKWAARMDAYRRRLRDICAHSCGQLLAATETREALLTLVEDYAEEKRRLDMAEFGDFTIAAHRLVTRFPSIGRAYRRRFGHVLLDEYQDTSTTQAALLAALFRADPDDPADREAAVTAVGDPFQSIYAWRGASPGAFRLFERDFGLPEDRGPRTLSVTWRNPTAVLEAANDLTAPLRQEPRRRGSSPMREVDVPALGTSPGAPVGTLGVLGYGSVEDERDGVARFCQEAVRRRAEEGRPRGGGVAVLFRRKRDMDDYRAVLESRGLSTLVVGHSALLDRPETLDVLALLHAAVDHTDSRSLMRLLATPRFGMTAADLTALGALAGRANDEARFHALVEAGIADADTPPAQRASVVAKHRDSVANIVFLPDLLVRDGADPGTMGERGAAAVRRAGAMLREVQDAIGRPLGDIVRAAIRALDLDVDVVVAQGLRCDGGADPTLARAPLEALLGLADTYVAEVPAGRTPSLRGFMAWIDSLRQAEDESVARRDGDADVELMTIHQAKGLEWDAVAVVGMAEGVFPSRQSGLKITAEPGREGGWRDGAWQPPEYHAASRTWLTDPTAVPVPVRADAGILPRFPHDAPVGGDPVEALSGLDDIETIDDELRGSLRRDGDGVEDIDPDILYLTQEEEYGRRQLADERRLAYVALTRSRRDVLLTYARGDRPDDADDAASGTDGAERAGGKTNPSVFWTEVHDALRHRPDVADVASLDGTPLRTPPDGYFAGERAHDYLEAVVGAALREPRADTGDDDVLPWPIGLGESVRGRLEAGAEAVRALRRDSGGSGDSGGRAPGDGDGPLLARARRLAVDEDLMAGGLDGGELDRAVERRARRILARGRQNVTALQAIAGGMTPRQARDHWRSVVRPIPSVSSPAAQVGTRFHRWAERFVVAGIPGAEPPGETRQDLLDGLARRERDLRDPTQGDAEDRDLAVWQRRLASSPWALREPVWAERYIVAAIPRLDDAIVNGKLDAVFRGGIDDARTGRYTIVDWKTGVRPTRPEDAARRLVQLDLYRLLLSQVEGVPLSSIDAVLYYVSEPDARLRELRARPRDEDAIIDALKAGMPDQSDDD